MTELTSYALFAEVRARLGQALVRSLAESLAGLAALLERAGVVSDEVQAALTSERAALAERARARLFELSFEVLERNQTQPEEARRLGAEWSATEPEWAPGVAHWAETLQARVATRHPDLWHRMAALTGVVPAGGYAPLGPEVQAWSVLEALRPSVAELAARPVVQDWMLEHWLPGWALALGEIDAMLALPTAPAPAPAAEPAATAIPEPIPALTPEPTPEPTVAVGSPPAPLTSEATPSVAPMPEAAALAGQVLAREAHAAEALLAGVGVAAGLGPEAAHCAPAQSATRLAGAVPRPEALERDAVAFAHHHGLAPYGRAARQQLFAGLRTRMQAAEASAGAVAALDLVAAMFDYVVDDARMPAAAKPLMWRLQWPVAALAALDVGFLGDDRRSVRRLVESIAAIALACAEDVVQGSELHRRLDTVVRAVEVVAHAFQVRSTVLDEQVQREYQRASQGLAQLLSRITREKDALAAMPGRRNRRNFSRRPSPERERDVTQRIQARLMERFGEREWPLSVRQFLMSVWLRHMRSAALRDGEQSPSFQVAQQVVDDLLWSVDEAGPRPRRSELASRIPQLIKLLVQGVGESGAKPAEFRPFLDELFLIHLRRMQRPAREGDVPGSEPEPEPDHEPAAPAASGAGTEPDTQSSDAPVLLEQWAPPPEPTAPATVPSSAEAMIAGLASELELSEPAGQTLDEAATTGRTSTDQRLLTVLGSLDLDDFPLRPRRTVLDPDQAMARLTRGSWLEMTGRDGQRYEVKVAWVNPRRTVVLMVRRADGRAVSLRATELRERFAAQRAVLIEAS